MRKLLLFAWVISLLSAFYVQAQTTQVDVCVYGGTSAGVIAAYTARMQGKSVLLIEPGNHLGGLSSGGLGYTDIGNKYAVIGLARDFYRRIGKHYGKFEQWIFEPHVAENTFNYYRQKANVEVWYDYRIVAANKTDLAIQQIEVEKSSSPSASSNRVVKAKMFIDCSYEGDLMAKAGVRYTIGREANSQYGETYNGVQLLDKHQFPDGISPYKIPGKPESGLLWGISDEALQEQGSGDEKVQAYNFRICLTNNEKNKLPITEPENYDASRYELLLRYLAVKPSKDLWGFLKFDLMPNNKTDINNNGPFSTDMIGRNYDYPEASYERRRQIIKEHEDYIKGLLYFIGNDNRMPKHLRDQMLQWGYPKDEYTDNNHWSHQAYIREARRMVGEYVMTQHNCEGKVTVEDGVGMAAYTMDSHNTQRIVVDGMVKNEGDVQIGGFPPYPISYRSLIPKATECKNLFVPVCLSATHIAYGSIRMEPVFMVLGQASAQAAVMAIDSKVDVQQVDVKKLQQKLSGDPLADGSIAEILIDNESKSNVNMQGEWSYEKNASGCYGPSLLSYATAAKSLGFVRFTPDIIKAGEYDTWAYFPRTENGATSITIQIFDGKKDKEIVVKPNEIKIEGQTSGEWVSVGKFNLPSGKKAFISITTKNADGIVVADAVLFVPH